MTKASLVFCGGHKYVSQIRNFLVQNVLIENVLFGKFIILSLLLHLASKLFFCSCKIYIF